MKKLALAAFAVVPLLFGCAASQAPSGPLFARDFTFVVKGVDADAATLYITSEKNPGDPHCVTVAIDRGMLKNLKARYGDKLETAFLGKTVHVQGKVRGSRLLEPSVDHSTGPVLFRWLVVPRDADHIELI